MSSQNVCDTNYKEDVHGESSKDRNYPSRNKAKDRRKITATSKWEKISN